MRKVTWNGVEYKSIQECADALGIKHSALFARLKAGLTSDDDIKRVPAIPMTWNGVEYPSIRQAALANGKHENNMWDYYHKGYTSESDFLHYTPCEWNGVSYRSISEAARANNISPEAMRNRIENGYTSDADFKYFRGACVIDGIEYESQKAAADALGVTRQAISAKIKRQARK